MNTLLKPHVFIIKDIKRYNLTSAEINEHDLKDDTLLTIHQDRENYVRQREQKYGKKQKPIGAQKNYINYSNIMQLLRDESDI